MHWIRRLELALRAMTALSAVIAVVALAWPVSVPEAEIAPVGLAGGPAAPRHPERAGATLAQSVAQGNIFSTTRSAPRVRYRPIGPAVGAEVSADADLSGGAGQSGVPQLFGIVPGIDGAAALLRLDPAVPGALLYRTGDRGGRYRVDEIGERSVVLSGPAGRVELRLPAPLEAVR